MKIKFLKPYGKWAKGSTQLVNDNFGKKAIASGLAELADTEAEVPELPITQGKGEVVTDDPKKKPTSKRKPKNAIQSK